MPKNKSGNDEESARKLDQELPAETPVFISERYEIKRVIGGGVNTAVYEAYDKSLKKLVAIKKLHNTSTPVELIRFQREAKLTSSLTHPNVRSVLDFGLTGENEPYLVLELAKGESVAEHLKKHGAMDVETALDVLIQVAAGLEHAHNRSIVHRDIKPSNVMLVERGRKLQAQIVDFGIAKSKTSMQDITGEGVGLGTPLFMSPEQVGHAEIDQRSDIYSFGCLMYDMLTGQPPFVGATALDTVKMHTDSPPPALSDKSNQTFPESLELIVNKTLAKNPADRYSSIKELSIELENELHRIQNQRTQAEKGDSNHAENSHSRYGALDITGIVPKQVPKQYSKKRELLLICGLVAAIAASVYALVFLSKYLQNDSSPSMTSNPFKNRYETDSNFLYTRGTWTSDEAATPADLAELVNEQSDVQRLNLGSGPLIDGDALTILQNKNVTFLTYTDKPLDEKTLRNISKIRSLRRLKVGGKKVFYDTKAIALLKNLPYLMELCLFYIHVDDNVLSSTAQIKSLILLNFESGSGMKEAKWELLKPLPRLDNMTWNDTDIDDNSLIRATTLKNLRILYLKGTSVSDVSLNRLAALKHLRLVDITGCENVSTQCVKKLKARGVEVLLKPRAQRIYNIPEGE